jgi:hypothetical protein
MGYDKALPAPPVRRCRHRRSPRDPPPQTFARAPSNRDEHHRSEAVWSGVGASPPAATGHGFLEFLGSRKRRGPMLYPDSLEHALTFFFAAPSRGWIHGKITAWPRWT